MLSFSKEVKNELRQIYKKNENDAKKVVRKAFINSGLISEPEKDYSLQIIFKNQISADYINKILNDVDINSKIINKGQDYCLYIKNGDEIASFLAFVGANLSVIKFEEIRVMKDMKNSVNRIVNCETANLNKTVSAAINIIQDIKYLKSKKQFENLDDNLKEIANLRIKHPDLSLQELGGMLSNPTGKSGVSHRLKKISQITKEFRKRCY